MDLFILGSSESMDLNFKNSDLRTVISQNAWVAQQVKASDAWFRLMSDFRVVR